MNKETLAALRGSIKKWEMIVAGTGRDNGADNCPLCAMFLREDCAGCPVSTATDETCCHGSPHVEWLDYQFRKAVSDDVYRVFDEKSLRLAKAELKFLKSLLPKKAKGK